MSKQKIGVARRTILSRNKKLDVSQKVFLCRQNMLMLLEKVFHVNKKMLMLHKKSTSCRQKEDDAAPKKYFVLKKVINFFGNGAP